MPKINSIKFVVLLVALGLIGWIIYSLPPVQQRLGWRMDFAMAYLRGVVNPVSSLPTARPQEGSPNTPTPTNTTIPNTATATPNLTLTSIPTTTQLPSPTPMPEKVSLPAPAYEKQDINNCGPASMTMYLRFYGWEGDQNTIAEVIKPQREDRNVNVEELSYFARTHAGWLSVEYRVGGDLDLLKQLLAAGMPVMIEESFYFEETYWPNDDKWAAHYFLVTGYDEENKTFIGQDSYYGTDRKVSYSDLDRYWQAFNRVYVLIFPPDREGIVKEILGSDWDADENRQHALEIAQAETESEPKNAFAWFNLGTNLVYFERYIEASEAYDQAREIGLPQRMLRYQFGPFIAYFHSGQIDELLTLTEYALERTPNAEEALLWQGWALYRQGDTAAAVESFSKALAENPTYQDAQYALDFVQGK